MSKVQKTRQAGGRTVDCPVFDPNETAYEQWRKEVEVWRMVTTLPKKKHGSFVFLAMRGRAKDAVFQMNKDTLGQTNGFEEVLKVLDEIYMPQVFEKKSRNFNDLWKCFRKPNDPVIEWAVDWHGKFLNYESVAGVLPSETAAMMFIMAAGLTTDQRQSIRMHMGTNITYAKVREIVKVMFVAKDDDNQESPDTFFNDSDNRRQQDEQEYSRENKTLWGRDDRRDRERSYRGDYRNRYYDNVERTSYRNDNRKRHYDNEDGDDEHYKMRHMNPVRNGRTMTCNFCGSKYHFRRFCTEYANMQNDRYERKKTERKYAFNY